MRITKKPCVIYALCEPDGNFTVRYVGKTEMGMEQRYKQHTEPRQLKSHTHKNHWIKGLMASGQKPIMVELECVPVGTDWEARERFWIAYYRELGYSLTNATDGGEGASNPTVETRAKMSDAQRGNTKSLGSKRSPETRQRMRDAAIGRRPSDATLSASQSPEAIAKRSKSQRGQKRSPETCARISESKMGNKNRLGQSPSDETRQKIREANVGKTLSPEHREKIGAAHKGRIPSDANYKALNSPETIAKRAETYRRKTQLKRLAILFALLAESKEAS